MIYYTQFIITDKTRSVLQQLKGSLHDDYEDIGKVREMNIGQEDEENED